MGKENNPASLAEHFDFWKWLITSGVWHFFDRWLIFHLFAGHILQHILKMPLHEMALKAFLPFSALLIGLVFAWSGSIASILQAQEMDDIRKENGFGVFKNYVFNFQLATLVNFILIIIWIFISLDPFKGIIIPRYIYIIVRTVVFAFSSLVIRECWCMILRLQLHLISIALIRDEKITNSDKSNFQK